MPDWFDDGGSGSPVDVAAVLDGQCTGVLWDCVAMGALVSLGLTSDGGALGVTVTVDGRWRRQYVRTEEDLAEWLAEAGPAVRLATEARPASSGRGNGSRRSRGR